MHVIITNYDSGQSISQHGISQAHANRLISTLGEEGAERPQHVRIDLYPETREERAVYIEKVYARVAARRERS